MCCSEIKLNIRIKVRTVRQRALQCRLNGLGSGQLYENFTEARSCLVNRTCIKRQMGLEKLLHRVILVRRPAGTDSSRASRVLKCARGLCWIWIEYRGRLSMLHGDAFSFQLELASGEYTTRLFQANYHTRHTLSKGSRVQSHSNIARTATMLGICVFKTSSCWFMLTTVVVLRWRRRT